VAPRCCLSIAWSVALLVVPIVGGTLIARPAIAAAEQRVISLNQNRGQITSLIEQVGEATGRTILFDDQVRGTISIVAKRPVDLEEAWAILDASLSILGFSLLPSTEGNWRVSRVAEAVGESPFRERIGTRDSFVTTLIPLRQASPQAVLKVLEPLSGSRVTLVPLERTNSLIASGPERAIARLTTIADELDRVDQQELHHRVLRYRDVEEVESWVETLFESGALSERDFEIWSDARTNSFIYRGSEDQIDYFLRMLERVDLPAEGEGQLRILKVRNRDAEEVADLIQSLAGGGNAASTPLDQSAEGATTILSESDYSIVVDKPTRSLVIQAEPRVQDAIREVLEVLDQPPQLIAVDIKVLQVITPKSFSLGFAFNLPLSTGDSTDDVIARIVSNPGGAGLLAAPNEQTPLFGRVSRDADLPFTIEGADGVEIPIFDTAVIDAGEFEARTEILIEPSLIITAGDHNEIFVGDNFPVPVSDGQAASDTINDTGVTLSQTTNIERRDVGIQLGIDARAGAVGKIQLELEIELSTLAQSLAGNIEEVGPTFAERTLLATIRLDDGEIAMIALDDESQTLEGQAGTPFLSDIPFLGFFFRRRVATQDEARLVITAQARRLGSPAEIVADTIRRRLAFERRTARDVEMPTAEATGSPFAVLVTTRRLEADAQAIADGLSRQGLSSQVHHWSVRGDELYDVYVTSLDSLAAAAEVAERLSAEGWEADLIVLPQRS
jgi:general secretion pathway protein D